MSQVNDNSSYDIGTTENSIGAKLEAMIMEGIPDGMTPMDAEWADWSGMITITGDDGDDPATIMVPKELQGVIMDVMVVNGIVMVFTYHIRGYVAVTP